VPTEQEREEAKRLAKLSARERKEALAVHWRIAEDAKLSQATRDYARQLAETLETLVKQILKRPK
jgi:tRNA-dihydrouridine synthase